MKNILLFMPYGSVGGMERLALTFYHKLKKDGHNVRVVKIIKLKSDIINFNKDEVCLSNKDFSEMSFIGRLFFYLMIPFKLKRIINRNKVDVSIAFGEMCNFFSSLSGTKEYKVASIHSLKSVELSNNTLFDKFVKWGFRNSYGKLNKVVCISHAIKDDLIANCGYAFKNNLSVIYNPHDIGKIRTLALEDCLSAEEKELFNRYETVLFLGRFSNQKALWHLIRSFSEVNRIKSNTRLVLIGSGGKDYCNKLKELIEKLGLTKVVHFLGTKENPYAYLSRSSFLALTSYYEGTPNVIVEAIALKVPIISTNCTQGIGELMTTNWESLYKNKVFRSVMVETGYITPNLLKGDLGFDNSVEVTAEEKDYAKTLVDGLENKKDFIEMISKSYDDLLSKFDQDFVTDSYLKILN